MPKDANKVRDGFVVLDIHPNGHVHALQSRQQYLDARAEGRKPLVLRSAAPVDALPSLMSVPKAQRGGFLLDVLAPVAAGLLIGAIIVSQVPKHVEPGRTSDEFAELWAQGRPVAPGEIYQGAFGPTAMVEE